MGHRFTPSPSIERYVNETLCNRLSEQPGPVKVLGGGVPPALGASPTLSTVGFGGPAKALGTGSLCAVGQIPGALVARGCRGPATELGPGCGAPATELSAGSLRRMAE